MKRSLTLSTLLGLLGLLVAPPAAQATLRLTLADLQNWGAIDAKQTGDWLSMDIEPATVSPRYKGKISFRNFIVVGDFEEIEWQAGPTVGLGELDIVLGRVAPVYVR